MAPLNVVRELEKLSDKVFLNLTSIFNRSALVALTILCWFVNGRKPTAIYYVPVGNETQSFERERQKSSQISITKFRFSISLIIRNFEGKVP